MELVPGKLIHKDVCRLESCTPFSDFAAYIHIEPRFLVGKNMNSPGGDSNGGPPVDVAANSVLVFMNTVLLYVHVCGLQAAL